MNFGNKCSALLLIVATLTLAPCTYAASEKDRRPTHELTKLMVLFAARNAPESVRVSEIASAIRSSGKSDRQASIHARFGFPKKVTRLLGESAPESDIILAPNEKLSTQDILSQYLLLEFDSEDVAARAKARMKEDNSILHVEYPGIVRASASIPSDSGASQGSYSSPFDYQWALGSLNLYSAWDKSRGHAYVGHVDTGVKTGETLSPTPDPNNPNSYWYPNPIAIHPDLSQNFRPHRVWSPVTAQEIPTLGTSIVVDDFVFNFGATRWTILDLILAYDPPIVVPPQISRGHGTHTAGIIAANTNFSGTQAGFPNPAAGGVAGVCWNCSLHVAKYNQSTQVNSNEFLIAAAISWAISTGVQVVNLSHGAPSIGYAGPPPAPQYVGTCIDYPYNVYCSVLAQAAQAEVVVVAAAGNNSGTVGLQFPASDSRSLSVGAIDSSGTILALSQFGPEMLTHGVVAPGKDILSTVYPNQIYDGSIPCGDGYGRFAGQGFGPCTGTSMAAPFVTGIVALMRSINPLLTANAIKNLLYAASDRANARDQHYGAGKPNARLAVDSVLTTTNRLTPLFSLQTANPTTANPRTYLYSTFPQVGMAATQGAFLPPELAAGTYSSFGNPVAGFANFPGGGAAKAEVWIFTTHENPHNPAIDLKPLYRMSRRCYVGAYICNSTTRDVDHFYTTDYAEVQTTIAMGWGHSFDGIEGYVFPAGGSNQQPAGTVPLLRALGAVGSYGYKHAIFPSTQQSNMAALGFQYLPKTLGYVYLNPTNGMKPTYAF